MKIAILTGTGSDSTLLSVSMLVKIPQVEVVGILLDTQSQPFRRRLRNLRYNTRREGLSYVYFRLIKFIRSFLEGLASRVVDRKEVIDLLRKSFPERAFCLSDIGKRYNIPVINIDNLNSEAAADALRNVGADLGVVLGTRILKRSTFSIPRMGCINLHEGKVPEYRGRPPGFWELYENQNSAGVTVHFVDDGLDTGDIVGEDSVIIHPKDSCETLRRKLDIQGSKLLAQCVSDLAQGQVTRRPQPLSDRRPRTSPTRHQRQKLSRKPGESSEYKDDLICILKTIFCLSIYYTGVFRFIRAVRGKIRGGRTCVLLYHRVNNLCEDALTTSVERFAEHMATLRKHYSVVSTSEIVEKVRSGTKFQNNLVAIHFDDCYQDVYTEASRVLIPIGFPACCFISSGYVGTEKAFLHDDENCPFIMKNLSQGELVALVKSGFEVGAHTVNHVDLGQCSYETLSTEVMQSRDDLEMIIGKPVDFFSFPFGRKENICAEAVEFVQKAGYRAMFSAYGGYIGHKSDPFNLHRVGICDKHRPIDLIMEIEGFSFGALKRKLGRRS